MRKRLWEGDPGADGVGEDVLRRRSLGGEL